jgi:hypothetical protein
VEANSTGGQGSRRAVAPSDDDICVKYYKQTEMQLMYLMMQHTDFTNAFKPQLQEGFTAQALS